MSLLKYRLKSGKEAQGKQKIYFCCHPADFDLYFDKVCEDIFGKEDNCAIFYEADPHGSYDRDDLLFQLGDMQLFVVPVTKRLLTEPSRALELELPFALGKIAASSSSDPSADQAFRHIAVLPILFEGNLVDLFNSTEPFDGIQFLDRYTEDSTAISYSEKLAKFLQSVIVSSADDERIREEFRANIFLSYRKVDRALARKLMERIHTNELCRDVSIWYDEYLVPGESWEKAIGEALDASDLFVLNVTDNLLQPGNFVWKEEYPTALDSEKPILPVITAETNEAELRRMYAHIEDQLVRGMDTGELDEGLVWGLVKQAGKSELRTPNDDADHLYYIGLAYKNSVGVETAPERAVLLLENAGKTGCRRAFLVLGGMYEHGDGVERDEERAIRYYRDFIERQLPDFGTSKQGDLDLVLAYDAIGMIYINHSRLADAFATYAELNEHIEAMTTCYGSFKQINLPTSYERLGNIKKAMGEPAAAQEYFSRALQARLNPPTTTNIATAEDAAEEADAAAYNEYHMKYGLAVSLYSFGDICLQNRDLRQAEENLTRANALFVELAQETDDRDLQVNLNRSHIRMAQLCEAKGDTRRAREYYEKALEALEPVCTDPHDIEARSMRVVTRAFLSGWYRDSGQLDEAHALVSSAADEAEELVKKDGSPKMQGLLATTYERRGVIEEMVGNVFMAEYYLEQSIKVAEALVKETEDTEYQRGLAISYEKYASLLSKSRSEDDHEKAIHYLFKDLKITRELAKDKDDLQAQRDLSVCYDALYNAFLSVNPERSLEYGIKGLVVAYDLAERIGQPQELYELGISYYDVGRICADINAVCFQNALALWEKSYRGNRSPQTKQMIKMIRKLMLVRNPDFPLGPGYTGSIYGLVSWWCDVDEYDRDYADVTPLLKGGRSGSVAGSAGSAGAGGSAGPSEMGAGPGAGVGDDEFQPSCATGCLQLVLLCVIPVCAFLQVTKRADVTGLLQDRLGPHGLLIAFGMLCFLYGLTCIRWKK